MKNLYNMPACLQIICKITSKEVAITVVTINETKTQTDGFVFGISDEHEGEDILIHQNAFRGTHNAFSKLKPGDQVKGEIETNQDGKFRLQRYKKVTD